MLRTLHSAGYNLVIATDEFPKPLRMKLGTVLRDTDVDAFFDTIVTCRDVEKQKPSRRYYELVLDELNVPADQCVMVGDSWVRDLKPAQDLGMTTILVGDADPTENPDFEIDTVTQVEAVVDQVNA